MMRNHDALFQYALLVVFLILISILCIWGKGLDTTQATIIGGGIGTIAGLLKQTQSQTELKQSLKKDPNIIEVALK